MLEKTLERPLDCKEIKPVNPKGNQSWIFIGRTDAEAEAPILWPPDVKDWLTGKDPDAGQDWRQEEKGMTEDEMTGRHHRLKGREFEQALRVGDGQGILAYCSPWGRRVGHDWATELTDCYIAIGIYTSPVLDNPEEYFLTNLSCIEKDACVFAHSCLNLCDPTDCSPLGFSVHGISQVRVTGVGCHFLLQRTFPTQGLNTHLLHCRWIFSLLSHRGNPTCREGSPNS